MRNGQILLPMTFWAVLVQGASFASHSDPAQEQTASQSGEKSIDNGAPDGSKDTQARGQKDQMGEYPGKNEKGLAAAKQGTRNRRPSASQAKPASSRQQRSGKTSAADSLRTEMPRHTLDSHQTGSALPSETPNKPLKHPGTPVLPPTVALNGQQFKNSRDPGARMATSGGSANSTRGTAVINGSDIKRKP